MWRLIYAAIHAFPLLLINIIGLGCYIHTIMCLYYSLSPMLYS
uniref:Uncharacterized protein n=1 Tax=Enterococcus phage PMBT56 TaxID=3229530 RepID=A0AB39C6H4_9CAUD